MIEVTVRWFDDYLEKFECDEVHFGSDLLRMRLTSGQNRHIPLRQVRWFSQTPESHEPAPIEETLTDRVLSRCKPMGLVGLADQKSSHN